jgi:SapC
MTQIVPLNEELHRSLTVDGRASAAYGDNQRFAQVIVKEFPRLVVHYPILFSKNPQTGQLYCGAMLGFDEGENLFLREWTQREFYRPLSLQRGPFYARGPELAIDLDDPRVGAEGGVPLFTNRGQPTHYLQSIIWAFQDLKPGMEMTRLFIARLLELKLIEPVDIEVEFDDGMTRKCVGLYTINQEALEKLPDEVVLELFRRGYMRLIHLMIASLKQIPLMARKKHSRLLEATEGLGGVHTPAALG